MPSSSSATAAGGSGSGSAQYDKHGDYGDEHSDEHHDVFVAGPGPGPSPGISVMNLAHSNTITSDNTTIEKEKKKDGPAVKNTILLRGM